MNVANPVEQLPAARGAPVGGVLDLVRSYRRQLPTFLGVAGLIFLLVAAFTWAENRRYTAVASVVVSPRKAEVGSDRSSPLSDPTTDASVDTQVEVIRSPALAGQVVDRLGLADSPEFERLTHSQGVLERLGLSSGASSGPPLTRQQRRAAAIEQLAQSLDVRRVAQTFVLEIAISTPYPDLTSRIANAFADGYVRQSLQIKLDSAGSTTRLLRSQLDAARADATAAENAAGQYKIAHNLMSVGGSTVAEQELSNLGTEVATAQAGEAEARARYSTARQQLARGSNGEDVGEALNSPVVQELRKQRAEVSRQIADLSNRYGPRYPATNAAERQLAAIDGQIHSEVRRLISGLEAQSRVAAERAGALEANRNQTRNAVAGNNVASVRLDELQSRATAARQLYEELLGRVQEVGTQAATTQADARIATIAIVPLRPSSPNVPINLLVGALLAIAGGIAAVVLRQGLDQGLSTMEDVESRLGLPFLASLPTLDSSVTKPHGADPIAAVMVHKASAFAEAFRSLAVAVTEGSPRPVRTILLTSAVPNEGKTTTAICLARVLALSGKKVVLVDADLRRPSVAEALQLRPALGVHQVLNGEIALERALVVDEESGLSILPVAIGSTITPSPIEDGRFDALLDQLKSRFDLVILDGSPILPIVDGRLLAKKADSVIFLVRWRKTPEPAVEMAVHLLASVGASVAGVALSRVDLRALARAGYGDPAKYFKLYENYYHS